MSTISTAMMSRKSIFFSELLLRSWSHCAGAIQHSYSNGEPGSMILFLWSGLTKSFMFIRLKEPGVFRFSNTLQTVSKLQCIFLLVVRFVLFFVFLKSLLIITFISVYFRSPPSRPFLAEQYWLCCSLLTGMQAWCTYL